MNARKENSEWRALCIGFLLGDLVGIALSAPMCSRNVFQRAVLGCVASRRYSPRNDGAVGDGGHRSMYRDEAKSFLCRDCVGFSPMARSSWRCRGPVA